MKKHIVYLALLVATGVTPAFSVTPAYVSFNGLDTQPCTRVAPCRTITHALLVVGPAGDVDVIGSGIYDTFTISRSVTVEAEPGVVATIEVGSSGTGITVVAGPNDVVTLRNLNLRGTGGTGVGIQITTGGLFTIEDCVSQNFFHGLDYTANTSGNLSVKGGSYEGADTSIFLCCAFGARYTAVIDGVHVYGGGFAGINADGAAITITHSILTGSVTRSFGINVDHGTTVMENDVISAYADGIFIDGTAFISSCTITENSQAGIQIGLGTAFSRGNNTVLGNSINVAGGTLTPFAPL